MKSFTIRGIKVILLILWLFFPFTNNSLVAQSWDQIIKTVASDRAATDCFGISVSISGDYAIVGAYLEDHDTSGGSTLSAAGSAYIFKNNEGSWEQVQKIVASDRGADDYFGRSVSISGNYAIVGAYREDHDASGGSYLSLAGSAYIFKNNEGSWEQVQKIVASDRGSSDHFGFSVSISGDYAIVGADLEDHDVSGGSTLSSAGSAYIFKNNAGSWAQVQKIVASDRAASDQFGGQVSISGDYAIVGARYEDEDANGGSTLSNTGSAYIFKNNAGSWEQVQKIVTSDRASEDLFGYSVSISDSIAIVGAIWEDEDASGGNTLSAAGSAYIFKNNAGTWEQVQKIVASDRAASDYFGWSGSISGDYAIVGAYQEDHDASGGDSLSAAGSAYIFKNNSGSWAQVEKIVASDRAASDYFGYSVSISGDYAIVGAYQEDEDASGGNTLSNAGSAYIFNDPEALPVELTSFTTIVVDNSVHLNWETATEVNNYGFEIERASVELNEGMDEWNNIGFVHGHGNSYSPKSYVFIDNNPPAGNLKYRLKQIDLDGSYEYYGTIAEVTFGVTEIGEELLPTEFALYQNYPNPFNPATRIKYSIPAGEEYFGFMQFVSLRIYDILGNEVAVVVNEEKAPGNYEVEFNASNLASGTYIYQLKAGEFRQTKKAVLLK